MTTITSSQDTEALNTALDTMIWRINQGNCVLVLGPRVAVRSDDPGHTPLEELLALELSKQLTQDVGGSEKACRNLRHVANLLSRRRADPLRLRLDAYKFYKQMHEVGVSTPLYVHLARLPFRLCICASPDDAMFQAFATAKKTPEWAFYNLKKDEAKHLEQPTENKPLVYHLFGHYSEPKSLVLTDDDLIEFLLNIGRSTPGIHPTVSGLLTNPDTAFLFLGFGFHNWYLRALLSIITGGCPQQSTQLAFEDTQFFSDPHREETIGFFSGKPSIEFYPLPSDWEQFARQLHDLYFEQFPATAQTPPSLQQVNSHNEEQPLVFLSYASEDSDKVGRLAHQLQNRGVRVWLDKQNLRGGDDWDQVLIDAILRKVHYFIPVQTAEMMSQVEGVFHEEINAACKRQKKMGERSDGSPLTFIVPVKIGDCQSLSKLKHLHVLDVNDETGVDAVVTAIMEDWTERQTRK